MYTEKELMPMVSKWWSGKFGSASDDKSEQVQESDSHLNQKEQLVSNSMFITYYIVNYK